MVIMSRDMPSATNAHSASLGLLLLYVFAVTEEIWEKNDCWDDKEDYDFLDNFLVTEEVVAGKCLMVE